MKKYMTCLLSFLCLLLSCKKEAANGLQSELNGKWELRIVDGGFSTQHTVFAAGNGNTITFSGSNQYTRIDFIDGDTVTGSGTYTLPKGSTCNSSDITFIKFSDGALDNSSILKVSGDTMTINTNSCVLQDGVDKTYVKIK